MYTYLHNLHTDVFVVIYGPLHAYISLQKFESTEKPLNNFPNLRHSHESFSVNLQYGSTKGVSILERPYLRHDELSEFSELTNIGILIGKGSKKSKGNPRVKLLM